MDVSLREQIVQALDELSEEQQRRVLNYALSVRANTLPPGTPGEVLIAAAHELNFSPDDIADINEAIKDFERIDLDEWQ
jgi:hypothetical protein